MKHQETLKHLPFNVTISSLNAETSPLGAAISALTRSFRWYRRGVFGVCGVGITAQMCNRVTNHGDMGTFSKPDLCDPGWKSGESNTEIADQIYTQFPKSILVHSFFTTNFCVDLFIYQLLRWFIQTQIHVELTIVERQQTIMIHYTYQNSKHENINSQKSQTTDFRLLFYLVSTANWQSCTNLMSTVDTETLLFQANNEWHKTIWHAIAIWHSQDMAFTNMKTTIY